MSKGDSHCPKCGYPDVGEVDYEGIYDPVMPCPHCGFLFGSDQHLAGVLTSNVEAATARGIVLGLGLAADLLRMRATAHETLGQHESASALRSALLRIEARQADFKAAADGLAKK